MSVGCLLTLSPAGQILHRQPLWPWPSPEKYPVLLPDGNWLQFFPCLYTKFRIGYFVHPFPPVAYASLIKGVPMKTLLTNVPLTLCGRPYTADILLGLYSYSLRPAIILVESRPDDYPGERAWQGEPIAVATSNPPEGYIQHLDDSHIPAKTWSENDGLWEQLLSLSLPEGGPLFLRTEHKILLGHCVAPIVRLGPAVRALFNEEVALYRKDHPNG